METLIGHRLLDFSAETDPVVMKGCVAHRETDTRDVPLIYAEALTRLPGNGAFLWQGGQSRR